MLEMYLFKSGKNQMDQLVGKITEAVAKDVRRSAYVGNEKLLLLDENNMNCVDKLWPELHWVKAYELHEWFARNVLCKSMDRKLQQACLVTKAQLEALIKWCDEMCEALCILDPNVVPIFDELEWTKEEVQHLIDNTDFETTDVLYFSYW